MRHETVIRHGEDGFAGMRKPAGFAHEHDVIRHPLVRKIIDAYKKFESNINK